MLGTGILKGLKETARNFFGSYREADRLPTIQYPDERQKLAENSRSFPFLVYDGEDAEKGLRCVACLICEKECPPQCIYIIKDTFKKKDHTGKMQSHPKVFDIDFSVCMSCQICVEVCPFDSIKMDAQFELSNDDRFGGLLVPKAQLAKSNEYFHSLRPTEAREVDDRLAAQRAQAEAKKAVSVKPAPAVPAAP